MSSWLGREVAPVSLEEAVDVEVGLLDEGGASLRQGERDDAHVVGSSLRVTKPSSTSLGVAADTVLTPGAQCRRKVRDAQGVAWRAEQAQDHAVLHRRERALLRKHVVHGLEQQVHDREVIGKPFDGCHVSRIGLVFELASVRVDLGCRHGNPLTIIHRGICSIHNIIDLPRCQ